MATGLTVGGGLAVATMVTVAFAVIVAAAVFPLADGQAENTPSRRTTERLEVTSRGVARVTRRGDSMTGVVDQQGSPIQPDTFAQLVRPVRHVGLSIVPSRPTRLAGGYRSAMDVYAPLDWPWMRDTNHYYFVHRAGLLVGYDRNSRLRSGWYGPAGFAAAGARPARRFDGRLEHDGSLAQPGSVPERRVRLLTFPSAVFAIDHGARTVSELFRAEAGDTVVQADGGAGGVTLIATRRALYFRLADGVQLELPHINSSVHYVTLSYILADAPTDIYVSYRERDSTGASVTQLVRYSPEGALMESYPVESIALSERFTAAPAPLRFEIIEAFAPTAIHAAYTLSFFGSSRFGEPRAHRPWFLPVVAALALLSAVATLVLSRRHSFNTSRTIVWAILALALGPLGVALMLSLMEWPQREACPACGRQRVVNRDGCEHCARGFAAPERDGTEILELGGGWQAGVR